MTPGDMNMLKSLVAVAWADGKVEKPEQTLLEDLITGFEADDKERAEILAYAEKPRKLDEDIPLDALDDADREDLLANAAVMMGSDGERTDSEKELVNKLAELLGFDAAKRDDIVASAEDGAMRLGSRGLLDDDDDE